MPVPDLRGQDPEGRRPPVRPQHQGRRHRAPRRQERQVREQESLEIRRNFLFFSLQFFTRQYVVKPRLVNLGFSV